MAEGLFISLVFCVRVCIGFHVFFHFTCVKYHRVLPSVTVHVSQNILHLTLLIHMSPSLICPSLTRHDACWGFDVLVTYKDIPRRIPMCDIAHA